MRVDSPQMIQLPNDRSETFIRAIENNTNPQIDLVCCVLTNNRKDRYDAIKKVLCVDCPIPSQVLFFIYIKKKKRVFFLDDFVENITKIRSINVCCN
jgi:aubergine-like protein